MEWIGPTWGYMYECTLWRLELQRFLLKEIPTFGRHEQLSDPFLFRWIRNNLEKCNSSVLFFNKPITCKKCIFIHNAFDYLSTSGPIETIDRLFFTNSFSQGSYATSLQLSYRSTVVYLNRGGSWRFIQEAKAFSLRKVLIFLIGIHFCAVISESHEREGHRSGKKETFLKGRLVESTLNRRFLSGSRHTVSIGNW